MPQVTSKERLFREGVRLICARGYGEITVGDIEAAAGLTRRAGGFYRHFKSKEDLLVQAVNRMAGEMIAEIEPQDIASLGSIRAELLVIARALIRHARTFRPLRLLLQRESHRLPALRKAALKANNKLAKMDVVPWVEDALRRSGARTKDARAAGIMIFGAVLIHFTAEDRGVEAFGIADAEEFLPRWADHWAAWFERGARD